MARDNVMEAGRIKVSRIKAEQRPLKPQFNNPPQGVITGLHGLV